jgi:hypothetical protein
MISRRFPGQISLQTNPGTCAVSDDSLPDPHRRASSRAFAAGDRGQELSELPLKRYAARLHVTNVHPGCYRSNRGNLSLSPTPYEVPVRMCMYSCFFDG